MGTVNGTFLRGDPALRRRFPSSSARNHLTPANASTSSRCAVIAMPSGKPLFWPIGQGNHASSIQRPRQQPARSICKTLRTNIPGCDQSPLGCINPSIGGTTPFRRHPSWRWDCFPWPATRKVTPNRTAQGHGTDRWVERPQPNPTQRDEASLLAKGHLPGLSNQMRRKCEFEMFC